MKKALSLILALVLCLSLCACGVKEEKSNEIVLTSENFDMYVRTNLLFVDPDESNGRIDKPYARIELSGASTNYNYNNVSVSYKVSQLIRCKGWIPSPDLPAAEWEQWDHEKHSEFTITVKTDISGYVEAWEYLPKDPFWCTEHDHVLSGGNWNWEIVSVTGTLTPAG